VSSSRRRSDRLAELLDEMSGRPRNHRRNGVDEELDALVRLAGRVSALPTAIEPDPEFRGGLRAMLMAKIEREGIGATADEKTRPLPTREAVAAKTQPVRLVPISGLAGSSIAGTARVSRTRAALIIGVTAGALTLSGVSAASTDASPGEPLYQVKRSAERAQLALAGSDQSRAHLYFEFAHSRLREARKVSPERVTDVLADMDQETVAGVKLLATVAIQRTDPSALTAIASFVDQQRARLGEFAKAAGSDARDAVSDALARLDAVQTRTNGLASALAKGCPIPTSDDLGPVPTPC
jgi:hypothetical protein